MAQGGSRGSFRTVDRQALFDDVGRKLTSSQVASFQSIEPRDAGVEIEYRVDGRDLVIETIPIYEIRDTRDWWRKGRSYNRRIHPDGSWCLWGTAHHDPGNCNRCRSLTDMQGEVGQYLAAVAPRGEEDALLERLLRPARARSRARSRGHAVRQPRIVRVPLEAHRTSEASVRTTAEQRQVVRREHALVMRYADYLRAQHHDVDAYEIPTRDGSPLRTDLFDFTASHLVEAKGSITREDIRMAIGQLADYGHFIRRDPNWLQGKKRLRRSVLVPKRPVGDVLDVLTELRIDCIWEDASGSFSSNRGQR